MQTKYEMFQQAEARFERTEPYRPAIACKKCGETARYTENGVGRCVGCEPHTCPGCGTLYLIRTRHACSQLARPQ